MALLKYDDLADFVPAANGFANVGATCYFNAVLQAVASCPAFMAVLADPCHRPYFEQTPVGRSLLAFGRGMLSLNASEKQGLAAVVVEAVRHEARARRPHLTFDGANESAAEALTLLADLVEPAAAHSAAVDTGLSRSVDRSVDTSPGRSNPLLAPLQHRYETSAVCVRCRRSSAPVSDVGIIMHRYSAAVDDAALRAVCAKTPTAADAEARFAASLMRSVTEIDVYRCDHCGHAGKALSDHRLRMLPEVVPVEFFLYRRGAPLDFPLAFSVPAKDGGVLRYRLCAQVEHSGGYAGGHYWALAQRRDGVYNLNDSGVTPIGGLGHTGSTAIAFYHVT